MLDCGIPHPCLILHSSLIYFCCASIGFKFKSDCTLFLDMIISFGTRARFWFVFLLLSYFLSHEIKYKKPKVFKVYVICFVLKFCLVCYY